MTLIAANTHIVGDIRFQDQLHISGRVEGNVIAEEDGKAVVTVAEEGLVKGEIHVPNVVINGNVDGNVHGTERVELAPKAAVQGNVYYNLIEMRLGASVDGQLVHVAPEAQAPAGSVHPFPAEGAGGE